MLTACPLDGPLVDEVSDPRAQLPGEPDKKPFSVGNNRAGVAMVQQLPVVSYGQEYPTDRIRRAAP